MNQDQHKQMAAAAALEEIEPLLTPDAVIGVGTGSTANHFIDGLELLESKFDAAVASSDDTRARLEAHGIRVIDANQTPAIVVYVDGADEVDAKRRMIKGGGGALTREKILAASADRFVCIVDASKRVERLGAFPLPVEVIPMARGLAARKLAGLGGEPVWREQFVTDNGNVVLDVHHLDFTDPEALEQRINNIVGVVSNGIFAANAADLVISAGPSGVERY